MGNRHDDRSPRRPADGPPRQDVGPRPEGVGPAFDRREDMGGSHWSGASGRGGMSYGQGPGEGGYPSEGGYRPEGGYRAEGGYFREGGYRPEGGYFREGGHPREGGYPREGEDREGEYAAEHGPERSTRREGADFLREGADNVGGYPREGGFASERGFGHVPGQRWGGGYGGGGGGREGPPSGRGFAGSDFGPAREIHGGRHFGNEVDRASSIGHGYHGTDLGMGAPERGPHYGKGPKGYKRSDARIHDDVCEAIAHQGHIDASNVDVKVVDAVVTLSGTVMHRHDKKGLERIVEHSRGVDEVHNELRLERHPRDLASPAASPSSGNNGTKNGKSARS